jgi:hypothetical protein
MDLDETVFGPDALQEEVKAMPGLKSANFMMAPHWLKPADSISTFYSLVIFAISDPDGSLTGNLFRAQAAMFGKEVKIKKWIDKPLLVQCSCYHALGHNKTSRACPLGQDSIKCYICSKAHSSEQHDQHCPHKHAVTGICDCKQYKCLNCHKSGHHCRDIRCLAWDHYYPCMTCKTGRTQEKGKSKEAPAKSRQVASPTPRIGTGIKDYNKLFSSTF